MRKLFVGMPNTQRYESLTWLTCCEDSLTPGQTAETHIAVENQHPPKAKTAETSRALSQTSPPAGGRLPLAKEASGFPVERFVHSLGLFGPSPIGLSSVRRLSLRWRRRRLQLSFVDSRKSLRRVAPHLTSRRVSAQRRLPPRLVWAHKIIWCPEFLNFTHQSTENGPGLPGGV